MGLDGSLKEEDERSLTVEKGKGRKRLLRNNSLPANGAEADEQQKRAVCTQIRVGFFCVFT